MRVAPKCLYEKNEKIKVVNEEYEFLVDVSFIANYWYLPQTMEEPMEESYSIKKIIDFKVLEAYKNDEQLEVNDELNKLLTEGMVIDALCEECGYEY